MFTSRKKSFWTSMFRTRERFSIEELGFLHEVLTSNPVVHEGNKNTVIEALRSIAELMIWGDQHDPSFFEFFAEHQTLAFFHHILSQDFCRRGEVAVQILQTLSILTQNIQSDQAIYYLFSNNHVNAIISQDFDFEEDEVLGYYISFLKTISLKLNNGTIQFFFQESNTANPFPLYMRTIQFFRHDESMVRAAVRTATLNIYNIKDAAVMRFLQGRVGSDYIRHVALYVKEQCTALHVVLPATADGTIDPKRLDLAKEELDDILYYCNDLYHLMPQGVGEQLVAALWHSMAEVVLSSFDTPGAAHEPQEPSAKFTSFHSSAYIKLLSSFFVLERTFQILEIPGIVNALFASLFLPRDTALLAAPLTALEGSTSGSTEEGDAPGSGSEEPGAEGGRPGEPCSLWVIRQCLHGKSQQLVTGLVRFLVRVLQSRSLDEDVLQAARMLPARRSKTKALLTKLTRSESEGKLSSDPDGLFSDGEEAPHVGQGSSEDGERCVDEEALAGAVAATRLDDEREPSADEKATASTVPALPEVMEAPWMLMIGLLDSRALEGTTNHVAWIFHQFLPEGSGLPAELERAVERNFEFSVNMLRAHFAAPWCDGLPSLLHRMWSANRRKMLSPVLPDPTAYLLGSTTPRTRTSGAFKDTSPRPGLSTSIAAANQAGEACGRFVELLQLRELLQRGELSPLLPSLGDLAEEPVGLVAATDRPLPVKDGSTINLDNVETIPCKVAFSRGAERNVFFCSDGRHTCAPQGPLGSACVFLADAEPSGENFARVVAMAPLAGAEPAVDPTHPSWLHLRVRPPLNALSLLCQGGSRGKRLSDGRWTLAFPSAEEARRAKEIVEKQRRQLRANVEAFLLPILQ